MDVDIVRCECAIDMVDGTLGTLDLTLSTRDIMGFAPVFFSLRIEFLLKDIFENFHTLEF